MYVACVCGCEMQLCAESCGRESSFSSASGRAVSTQLIVRKEAGERQGEATGLINKSSVLSLRTQPAEGTEELWLSAREVGAPCEQLQASSIMPHAEGVLGLGSREVFRAAAAALEKTRGESEVCM